jgi:hypothetical protein
MLNPIFYISYFIFKIVRSTIYGASRFARFTRSRRAIRSITFAPFGFAALAFGRYGGSASIPLAKYGL